MVDRGWAILCGNEPLSAFGKLLHDAWIAKQSLDEGVSNTLINEMYELGLRNGALGGKLLGAGGGGFLLFFAPPEMHGSLANAFSQSQMLRFKIDAPGSEVIFSSSNRSRV